MEFIAKLNYVRVSPQKARLVLELIKGRRVEEALDTLLYTKKGIAPKLYKLLRSAVENANRSEEHTSELQSLRHLVCRLLLEKKKKEHRSNRGEREASGTCGLLPSSVAI